jgi:hypothetical protein
MATTPPMAGTPDYQPPPAPRPQLPLAQGPANPALKAPTGIPADARGGQVSTALSPAAPAAASAAPLPLATSAGATPYAGITTNVPGSATDYTDKTITPGAGVDRLALAKSNFENFAQSTDPEYQATLRDANQAAAGAGQIGSGMLRGRLGDIATTRSRDLQTAATSNLNSATSGSIDDAYKNLGIAQQQQGVQIGQQQSAFDQQQRKQALDEALRNGDFQRYYQLLQAGEAGSPADTQLALAGDYGKQSSAAGQSAGSLAGSAVRNNQIPLAA